MRTNIRADIQSILAGRLGAEVRIEENFPIGGGCINECAKIQTDKGLFFAKWNDSKKFPKMLELEAKGLALLRNTGTICIPEVVGQRSMGDTQYLVLEYVSGTSMKNDFWYEFGSALAKLHKNSCEKFGLDHNNYIGSLTQSNAWHDNWAEFFIHERLQPQLKMAVDVKRISPGILSLFNKLFSRLEEIFPKEQPSLLHGDLWSGNYLTSSKGESCLIDPAVYYGHREMDIAMTKLFGGFSSGFYEGYLNEFPLEKGWQQRVDVCNLYPLMVHVNLFGGSYPIQVESILKRF